jgi:short-subunit dehydrogenase
MAPVEEDARRALVTGASGGLGAAIARQLAARGIEVWLAARRATELEAQVKRIEAAGGKAHPLLLDIAEVDAAHARLVALDKEVGGIGLVVANAAVAGIRASISVDEDTWENVRDILHTNLTGTAATLMPFVPRMIERKRGHLVTISSVAPITPGPRLASYGASKAGLNYFARSLDIALRPHGIAVTNVTPGFMRTPAAEGVKEPMPFIVEEDDAARRIDRGIRRRCRNVSFPWPLLLVMHGTKLLPRFIYDPAIRRVMRKR